MSKSYPSNLSDAQSELLKDLLPEAKPSGQLREADRWEVLNTIVSTFWTLVEGVRWRALT
jgi:putative transposase